MHSLYQTFKKTISWLLWFFKLYRFFSLLFNFDKITWFFTWIVILNNERFNVFIKTFADTVFVPPACITVID